MAHKVETAALGKTPAWHGLGDVMDDEVVTAEEMMRRSGLTWEVELQPLYMPVRAGTDGAVEWHLPAPGDGGYLVEHMVPVDHVAVRRTSDHRYLGNVSPAWQPVQPWQVFDFMDVLTDPKRAALGDVELSVAEAQARKAVAKYHTGGSLRGGKEIWVLVKVGDNARIGGIPEEEHERFVFCTNGYERGVGMRVMFTEVRVVCANTQQMAIGRAQRVWTFSHVGDVMGKIEQARRVLLGADQYFATFEELAEKLIGTKLSEQGFKRVLDHLIPLDAIENDPGGRKVQNLDRVRNHIHMLWQTEPTLDHCRGTAWCAYNAVTQYEDWERTTRDGKYASAAERRFERSMTDTALKDRAAEILLEVAAA